MSARKIEADKSLQQVTVQARQGRLTLSSDAVVVTKNGVEFRSLTPFSLWTEMTVSLESARNSHEKVQCNGVVVACSGNRHLGYIVSMLFTGLSKQSQARLNSLVSLRA